MDLLGMVKFWGRGGGEEGTIPGFTLRFGRTFAVGGRVELRKEQQACCECGEPGHGVARDLDEEGYCASEWRKVICMPQSINTIRNVENEGLGNELDDPSNLVGESQVLVEKSVLIMSRDVTREKHLQLRVKSRD